MNKSASDVLKHHYVRTIFASIFGAIALWLIVASVLVVWLNRTVTDTNTYVTAVAPLASKPEVKEFITQKIDEQITNSASPEEIALVVLKPEEIRGKTPDQIKTLTTTVVRQELNKVISLAEFTTLWRDTNQSVHKQALTQLQSNESEVTLDFDKTVFETTKLLSTTRLAPIVGQVKIDSGQATVKIKRSDLQTVRGVYDWLQRGMILIILATVSCVTLAVIISVHHMKTLRRIALLSALGLLSVALTIAFVPSLKLGGADPATQALTASIASTLLRSLKMNTFILGTLLLIGVAVSKVVNIARARGTKKEAPDKA